MPQNSIPTVILESPTPPLALPSLPSKVADQTEYHPAAAEDLSNLVEQFLTHLAKYRNSSPHTVVAYRDDLRCFVEFCETLGITTISQLHRPNVHRYAAALPRSGKRGQLAPASVARRIHALRSLLGYLMDLGLVDGNLAAGIVLPVREKRLPRYPDDRECELLLGATTRPRDRAIVALMMMAGLRRSEVLDIDVEDLSAGCTQLLVHGKGRKERSIPLCLTLRGIVEAHLEQCGALRGPLFIGATGERMTVTCLTRMFRRLLKATDLAGQGITPHKLRHAFGTSLIREGVDVATVAELMGHSNISTTSIYLHASPATKRAAVDRLPWGRDDSRPLAAEFTVSNPM
jgi:site-specific recombinase XerD